MSNHQQHPKQCADALALLDRLIERADDAMDRFSVDDDGYMDSWQSEELGQAVAGAQLVRAQLADLMARSDRIGSWLSAAIDDPSSCAEFKSDIEAWLSAYHAVQGRVLAFGRRREGE